MYGAGGVALRALSFLLLPVYTRYLDPGDFGVVAAAGAVSFVLAAVFPLGLHGAMARDWFGASSPEERARDLGTVWTVMVAAATTLALLAEWFGPALAGAVFREIPYDPYLRLSVWTAYCNVISLGSLTLLRVQSRPGAHLALSGGASLLSTAAVLYLVVVQGGGAYGYLVGVLLGAAASVPVALWIAARELSIGTVRRAVALQALAYGLPLVPHAVGSWVTELSDRVILERLVPIAELGVYSLGYQLGGAVAMLTTAFNAAWVPFLFGILERGEPGAHERVARLTTYFVAGLAFAALGWALLLPDLLPHLVAPAFRDAHRVAAWVTGAGVLGGLYLVPAALLFWSKATRWVPVATIAAAATNVALNLALVPRYGSIAAAWSTLAANGVMLLVVTIVGQRVHPLPYEYRRVGSALAVAGALFAVGVLLGGRARGGAAAVHLALWLAYPLILGGLRLLAPAKRA